MVTSVTATKNRAVVLSDNDKLVLVIQSALKNYPGLEVVRLALGDARQPGSPIPVGDCQLIIVAAISPTSEPIAMLAQAALVEQIGRIPLLIISDRSFLINPGHQIAHLDFPFRVNELPAKVRDLLEWRALPLPQEAGAYAAVVAP
jgi:hypothetical protein